MNPFRAGDAISGAVASREDVAGGHRGSLDSC